MKSRLRLAIAVFLLFIAACLLSSCKKNYCWKCVTTSTTSYSNSAQTDKATSTSQLCDKTQAEINEAEKAASRTINAPSGNVLVTITTTMSCSKQN